MGLTCRLHVLSIIIIIIISIVLSHSGVVCSVAILLGDFLRGEILRFLIVLKISLSTS
jgi:hypothetical protein